MSLEPRSEVVVAGAGTGKTHALVNAYLFALLGLDGTGVARSPSRLLAITFTDKAASEMRRRVAVRLQALVRNPHEDADVAAAAARTDGEVPDTRTLERLLRQLPGAPISTFHTLCSSLLRDLALPAGIDPGFVALDPVAEQELLEETAAAVVLDHLAGGDAEVAELSAQFSLKRMGRAAGLVDGLVKLLGALAERGLAARDLGPVVTPEDADARLFSLFERTDESVKALWTATKTGSAPSQRNLKGAFVDYRRLRALLEERDPDEEHELASTFLKLRDGLERASIAGRELVASRDAAAAAVREIGAAMCDVVTAPQASAVQRLLGELEVRAAREKDSRGVLGFGDMLLRARDVLREQPAVRARVKARFDRLFVDEYQDTSPVQEDLVALLAEEPARGDAVPHGARAVQALKLAPGRLFVVGDPKQSIYGFRGADVRVFDRTLDVVTNGSDASEPTGERRTLARCWRSRPPVVELVNLVAQSALPEGAFGVKVLAEDLLTAERAGDGRAGAIWQPHETGDLEPDEAEALVVARRIRELLDEGLPVGDVEEPRPCRAGDIAVLVRRVRAAAPIARALAHQGVSTEITGGEGFFQRPEVMDVICALQLVVEPDDGLATLAVLRSPFLALPDDTIAALLDGIDGWKRGLGWREVPAAARAAGLDDEVGERLERFDALLGALRAELHRLPASRLVDALLDEGGYALGVGVERDAGHRLANVEKLRALCEGRPGEALRRIQRLWRWLDDPPVEAIAAAVDPDVDAVRIMTIHQAKGLEFPVVVLADAAAQLPAGGDDLELDPDLGLAVSHRNRPIDSCSWARHVEQKTALLRVRDRRRARDEAEMARLLYVALTRARDHVFVVGEKRDGGGPSLRALLDRVRGVHGRTFTERLPVQKVPAKLGPRREIPKARVEAPHAPSEPPPRGRVRVAPSVLVEAGAEGMDAIVAGSEPAHGYVSARRRGRLGHLLVGRLGELLAAGMLPAEEQVRRAASACARSVGEDPDAPPTKRILDNVTATVHGPLRRLVDAGCALSFEEPMRVELGDEAVLTGAADVLARGGDWTAVLELKSTDRATRDLATAVQLAAYARAVAEEGDDVLVAAWRIGDPAPAAPAPPSDEAVQRLADALAAAGEASDDL